MPAGLQAGDDLGIIFLPDPTTSALGVTGVVYKVKKVKEIGRAQIINLLCFTYKLYLWAIQWYQFYNLSRLVCKLAKAGRPVVYFAPSNPKDGVPYCRTSQPQVHPIYASTGFPHARSTKPPLGCLERRRL